MTRPLFLPIRLASLVICLLLTCIGCRTPATMHVWRAPTLGSAVDKTVMIAIAGDDLNEVGRLKQELLTNHPVDVGRSIHLVDASRMKTESPIQLASYVDDSSSDLALTAIGRDHDVDFVLRGEIMRSRAETTRRKEQRKESNQLDATDSEPSQRATPSGSSNRNSSMLDPDESKSPADRASDDVLRISWRLQSLKDDSPPIGMPVVVDLETAQERYPDLATIGDKQKVLRTAAVRDTLRMVVPFVDRDEIQLAVPYALPRSGLVRKGNAAAKAGQWGKARSIWQQVVDRHPFQAAAMHNLALAHAAAQEYSTAKQLARRAVRLRPTPMFKRTLVWIELQQREYHDAFGLPDPPEGWFLTH